MEPQIHYTRTTDGVNIAYTATGAGPPLVYATGWPTQLDIAWATPFSRRFLETLGRGCTLIQYDMRGTGLSDRKVSEFTIEGLVHDLSAVVDDLGLGQFALLSLGVLAGPVCVTYAAEHIERVSHLILSSGFVRGAEITSPERQRSLIEYAGSFGMPLFSFTDDGTSDVDSQRAAQHEQGQAAKPAVQAALLRLLYSLDVSELLSGITAPTLVLHGHQDKGAPFDQGRELAARIRNARFVPLEGNTAAPWMQLNVLIPEIHRFLGIEAQATVAEEPAPVADARPGTAIIMFADIVDSTALTESLGDAAFRDRARTLDDRLRAIIREHAGTPIDGKLLGDGVLATFPAARDAIAAALACGTAGEDGGLPLHLGLHAGDVIREDNNVFGGAVNIAARISGLSAPGEVLVSRTVADLARTSAGVVFEDRGEHALKGIAEPQRVFAVRPSGQ